ncbi:GFA family protein [Pseudoalteromonas sp. T1lg75]|uniref:GFA family protein n=1 Tax=Pseudoalteromonas sp. T1lg75 TaxID=2077102 RepID=UPI000CF6149F|nr:GFA family protein [Pseudoalteromonas sp. T1lg75]
MELHGSCLCGGASYSVSGEVSGFYLCHCHRCQKSTGSAHGAIVFMDAAQLDWMRGEQLLTRYRVDDSRHEKCFCSVCGSSLPLLVEELGVVMVPAGSVDNGELPQPNAHIFTSRQQGWQQYIALLPTYEEYPPKESK